MIKEGFSEEVKFLRLPSMLELEREAERTMEGRLLPAALKNRYRSAQWQIYRAQRKAAVVAVEVCRPQQARELKMERKFKLERINQEFEDACVEQFSEYCTKGL